MEEVPLRCCSRCEKRKPLDAFSRKRGQRVLLAKSLVREAKNRPCADCGVQYSYYVMDLDHREGTTKRLGLSRLAKRGAAKQVILDEIAKCDVVCANCYRERTYRRKQWTKAKETREALL